MPIKHQKNNRKVLVSYDDICVLAQSELVTLSIYTLLDIYHTLN